MAPRGRKPISESGERMKTRPVRMPDDLWEDCLELGGAAFLRAAVKRAMARRRAAQKRERAGRAKG